MKCCSSFEDSSGKVVINPCREEATHFYRSVWNTKVVAYCTLHAARVSTRVRSGSIEDIGFVQITYEEAVIGSVHDD